MKAHDKKENEHQNINVQPTFNLKKALDWAPAIVVGIIIFSLSILLGQTIKQVGLGDEKFHLNGHFLFYALFAITLFKGSKKYIISLVIAILFGLIMEIMQFYTPNRSFQIIDIVLNSLGAALGLFLIWSLQHKMPKKLKNWLYN